MKQPTDKVRRLISDKTCSNTQMEIAKRWMHRAYGISDDFSKFFFMFAGFNSLYFLWSKIGAKERNERDWIKCAMSEFTEEEACCTLADIKESVKYFQKRTIQRMDTRITNDLLNGDPKDGESLLAKLSDASKRERLKAVSLILYLVRCNLVHGSKSDSGDDEQIIRQAVSALHVILKKTLKLTAQFNQRSA